jgi:hypothetical protein
VAINLKGDLIMSNYVETKKELDRIRSEYGCKGEVLFRSALQCVLECGQSDMTDDWCYSHIIDEVNERHDEAEAKGKILFISRDFEIAILECAREIAKLDAYDLMVYIQREVWLSNEGIDYQRAIELLKRCMYDIEERENCENKLTYQALENIGFIDDEIEQCGFGYLLEEENEE